MNAYSNRILNHFCILNYIFEAQISNRLWTFYLFCQANFCDTPSIIISSSKRFFINPNDELNKFGWPKKKEPTLTTIFRKMSHDHEELYAWFVFLFLILSLQSSLFYVKLKLFFKKWKLVQKKLLNTC